MTKDEGDSVMKYYRIMEVKTVKKEDKEMIEKLGMEPGRVYYQGINGGSFLTKRQLDKKLEELKANNPEGKFKVEEM